MNSDDYREDPLENLLDLESQEEFGAPEIRDKFEHGARSNVGANLSGWTAEHFASIYSRFRPHLVRHAKRYVSDNQIAEEVVQDAFLYLMTSLPELDTELGVLKFLKWKVRLLALDTLRAGSKRRERSVDNVEDYAGSSEDNVLADLEAAEDAAVIRLALAKLAPRHREALLANVYEEKSISEISQESGMDENATRQLLWRARKAFRVALIGEAEIHGKSIAEILSLAARKAALDARNNIGALSALAILSIGALALVQVILPNEVDSPEIGLLDSANQFESLPMDNERENDQNTFEGEQASSPITELGSESVGAPESDVIAQTVEQELSEVMVNAEPDPEVTSPSEEKISTIASLNLSESQFETALSTNVASAAFYPESYLAYLPEFFTGRSIEVFGGTGISAFIDYHSADKDAKHLFVQIWVDDKLLLGIPTAIETSIEPTIDGSRLLVKAENFSVVDENYAIFRASPLANAYVDVTLVLDQEDQVKSASMIVSRSE